MKYPRLHGGATGSVEGLLGDTALSYGARLVGLMMLCDWPRDRVMAAMRNAKTAGYRISDPAMRRYETELRRAGLRPRWGMRSSTDRPRANRLLKQSGRMLNGAKKLLAEVRARREEAM